MKKREGACLPAPAPSPSPSPSPALCPLPLLCPLPRPWASPPAQHPPGPGTTGPGGGQAPGHWPGCGGAGQRRSGKGPLPCAPTTIPGWRRSETFPGRYFGLSMSCLGVGAGEGGLLCWLFSPLAGVGAGCMEIINSSTACTTCGRSGPRASLPLGGGSPPPGTRAPGARVWCSAMPAAPPEGQLPWEPLALQTGQL